MIKELESIATQENQPANSQPHLYWFSGLTGTTASGVAIVPELERAMRSLNPQSAETNVTYLHSIASGEETNTDPLSSENRYIKYAQEILERLKKNQKQ